MRPFSPFTTVLEEQRGHLFVWCPVFFASGIGLYFSLPAEPIFAVWTCCALAAGLVALLQVTVWRGRLLTVAALLFCLGFMAAGQRTVSVAEPVLGFRYYGPVEGRVVGMDRSASDKVRLTLDQVVLARMAPDRTPARVRISLHGDQSHFVPEPGAVVGLTAHLSPPSGPVEPGGFDFRRHAWFQGLGAVGYSRVPAVTLAPAQEGKTLWLWRLRMAISAEIQRVLPGTPGGVAAAITVGDRSGIPLDVLEDLRAANLAHLLAISGLHMGLLTGFIFAAMRSGLALVPAIALRMDAKKVAAVVALVAGAIYLALSGSNVATERAFIMVAVMLVAVLFDRRALSLRSVAMAALVVLALRPEALMGPGFQMSFAATTSLVVVFGWLRHRNEVRQRIPRWAQGALSLVVSSVVAGLATAPIAAAHFNQVPHYGLIANMLSVPLMGSIVMPAAVLAAFLAPFGLHHIGLCIMEPPIRWIVAVADRIAGWEGALSFVAVPPPSALPLLVLGCLVLVLWRHPSKAVGALACLGAAVLWFSEERPPVLVSDTGGLVGVMSDEGRILSKARGDGFSARSWLENDGDPVEQAYAAERSGLDGSAGMREFSIGAYRAIHLTGRGAAERVAAACDTADLVVTSARVETPAGCQLFQPDTLRETGSLAIYPGAEGLRVVTAAERAGTRRWNMSDQ